MYPPESQVKVNYLSAEALDSTLKFVILPIDPIRSNNRFATAGIDRQVSGYRTNVKRGGYRKRSSGGEDVVLVWGGVEAPRGLCGARAKRPTVPTV